MIHTTHTSGYTSMRGNKRWIPALLMSLGVACADSAGPPGPDVQAARGTPVRWQTPVTFSAEGTTPKGTVTLAPKYQVLTEGQASPDFTVSFWAVRGEARAVHIEYDGNLLGAGNSDSPNGASYLWFEATDPAVRPDGSPIAAGDSVLITVSVNPDDMVAHFSPSGLQFGTAAVLKMWYTGAQGDINADGLTDTADATIEQTTLGIYYQHSGSVDWSAHPDIVDATADHITALVAHFSGYAVAW